MFVYRGIQAEWLEKLGPKISDAVDQLMGKELSSEAVRSEHAKGARGPHFPLILGYHRDKGQAVSQSLVFFGLHAHIDLKLPRIWAWHEDNEDRAEAFIKTPAIQRLKLVSLLFVTMATRLTRAVNMLVQLSA